MSTPAQVECQEHFLFRAGILAFAKKTGYEPITADDSFLKSHMIVILRPISR